MAALLHTLASIQMKSLIIHNVSLLLCWHLSPSCWGKTCLICGTLSEDDGALSLSCSLPLFLKEGFLWCKDFLERTFKCSLALSILNKVLPSLPGPAAFKDSKEQLPYCTSHPSLNNPHPSLNNLFFLSPDTHFTLVPFLPLCLVCPSICSLTQTYNVGLFCYIISMSIITSIF